MTKFTDGRVLWPSIGYDGKAIVFEHDFKIWQLDTKSGEAYALPITLVGSAATPEITHLTLNTFTDLAALAGRPQDRAHRPRRGLRRLGARWRRRPSASPTLPVRRSQVAWAPDSTRIAYLSQRDAVTHVFLYDFANHAETQLTKDAAARPGARNSRPMAKSIAFVRDRKELRVIDLEAKQERLLTGSRRLHRRSFAWSPDSKWIAYVNAGDRALRNVYVVPPAAAAGPARQVSFLANTNANSMQWSPDGKFLLYETSQRTETPQVARIDLVPAQPKYRRGQVRRSVQARSAGPRRGARRGCECQRRRRCEATAGRGGRPRARRSRRSQTAGEGGDRVRRHPRAPFHDQHRRPHRLQSRDQPRRPLAAVLGHRGRAAEPVSVSARRGGRRPRWTRRRPREAAAAAAVARAV